MPKIIVFSVTLFLYNCYSWSFENPTTLSEIKQVNFSEVLDIPTVQNDGFSVESGKYNQQNIALAKIKVNEIDPQSNESALLILKNGDIDFYVKDLRKDGFKVEPYQDAHDFYFIIADFEGKDVASQALGLAKYYYVSEVRVGKKIYDELFSVKSAYSVRIGTIKGLMNHAPVNITLDKVNWLIRGNLNLGFVWLEINHQDNTIKGSANNMDYNLKFDWSPSQVRIYGDVNRSSVDYTVIWQDGYLKGYLNNSPVELKFDMKEGQAGENIVEIDGYANNDEVSLKFNKISGELKGVMNNAPVEIKLENCDLYDFLQYFFVFMN